MQLFGTIVDLLMGVVIVFGLVSLLMIALGIGSHLENRKKHDRDTDSQPREDDRE